MTGYLDEGETDVDEVDALEWPDGGFEDYLKKGQIDAPTH